MKKLREQTARKCDFEKCTWFEQQQTVFEKIYLIADIIPTLSSVWCTAIWRMSQQVFFLSSRSPLFFSFFQALCRSPLFFDIESTFQSFVFGHSCSILIMLSVFLFTPVRFSQAKYKNGCERVFFSRNLTIFKTFDWQGGSSVLCWSTANSPKKYYTGKL